MIGKVFGDARLWNSEMIGKLRLDRFRPATARAAAQKVADGNAKSLTSFDVVVAGEVGVREHEDTRANWSADRFVELGWLASEQAAKLHFQQAEARGQSRIAVPAFHAGAAEISGGVHGKWGHGAASRERRKPFVGNDLFVPSSRSMARSSGRPGMFAAGGRAPDRLSRDSRGGGVGSRGSS